MCAFDNEHDLISEICESFERNCIGGLVRITSFPISENVNYTANLNHIKKKRWTRIIFIAEVLFS